MVFSTYSWKEFEYHKYKLRPIREIATVLKLPSLINLEDYRRRKIICDVEAKIFLTSRLNRRLGFLYL